MINLMEILMKNNEIKTRFRKLEIKSDDVLVVNIETEGKYSDPKIAQQIAHQVENIHAIIRHDKILVVLDQTTDLEVLPEKELNALGYFKQGEEPPTPSKILRIR